MAEPLSEQAKTIMDPTIQSFVKNLIDPATSSETAVKLTKYSANLANDPDSAANAKYIEESARYLWAVHCYQNRLDADVIAWCKNQPDAARRDFANKISDRAHAEHRRIEREIEAAKMAGPEIEERQDKAARRGALEIEGRKNNRPKIAILVIATLMAVRYGLPIVASAVDLYAVKPAAYWIGKQTSYAKLRLDIRRWEYADGNRSMPIAVGTNVDADAGAIIVNRQNMAESQIKTSSRGRVVGAQTTSKGIMVCIQPASQAISNECPALMYMHDLEIADDQSPPPAPAKPAEAKKAKP